MRFLDIAILAIVLLAIFGPKTLQSIARGAGKTVAQAKDMKDKVMSDLSLDEVKKVTATIPQVPLNPRQAVQMLITPQLKPDDTPKTDSATTVTETAQVKEASQEHQ